ncbi:MAG: flavin-containing monooxygenase, partial [Phenylobacterium sp.]
LRIAQRVATWHRNRAIADPDLRRKLTPDYTLGCKRVLISNDFYPALTRPNVELVVDAIARLTPQGVVDASGRLHEADVVIYATGFETNSFLGETALTGLGGLSLAQAWKAGPEAHLGITVAGFPNLFMLYGPNTNLGHNSIIYMIEAQVAYVLQALAQGRPLAVRPEVMAAYNDKIQADLAHTQWAGACTSWYKTAEGKILNNWPATAQAYADAVARFDAESYEEVRAAEPAE